MAKQRNHNEWFREVSLGGRKSCPCCRAKLQPGESIWSWGQYVVGKWQTIKHFCKSCFVEEVATELTDHTATCGCTVSLQFQSRQPQWLRLPDQCKEQSRELAAAAN